MEHLFIETDYGTIEIEFYPDKAPKHVEAIKKLANEGFYDGIRFHRVIPNFMILSLMMYHTKEEYALWQEVSIQTVLVHNSLFV